MLRVEPKQLDTLLHPQFDAEALKRADAIGKGLAASPAPPAVRSFSPPRRLRKLSENKTMPKVVLVRLETSPEDIVGMQVSQGILTVRGGMTSHAAVVARGMGTCCVSGCGNDNNVRISYADKFFEINGHKFTEGDWISLDGSTGNIYAGQIPTVAATGNKNFNRLMGWADAARRLNVEANADNPSRCAAGGRSRRRGHRPVPHRTYVLRRGPHQGRPRDDLRPYRRGAQGRAGEGRAVPAERLEAMYRIMGDRPMTIRYLDPPAARVPAHPEGGTSRSWRRRWA